MDLKEDIKGRLSVEDVIGQYVHLKRSGRNLKGLSPWTQEKTPSFMVSPEKQIWHDFSSGKGGDIFSFVMDMEGLDFKGALEHLARKAGLDPGDYNQGRGASNAKLKERLYAANEKAARFYQLQFSKNSQALEYIIKKRGFSKETALKFMIGYAPNNGSALVNYLKGQKFNDQEINKAGLGSRGLDMFRGRVVLPLQDSQGKVIGFTARLLQDNKNAPKYINTPQTLIYDKGRHVFGLHLAKEAIRTKKYAVVVEGNFDVIASHQAGISHVVATAGTAVTENHIKAISRFASDLRLCFDQDKAGQAAAERAIPLASKAGVDLQMIDTGSSKDPDELIKKDPKSWEKAVEQPEYALDWLMRRFEQQLDLSTASGKKTFSDEILRVVAGLEDDVEQDHYVQKVSKILNVSADALRTKLASKGSGETKKLKTPSGQAAPGSTGEPGESTKAQDNFLALLLHNPRLSQYQKIVEPEMLLSEKAKNLLKKLKQNPAQTPDVSDEYAKMLQLIYETLYKGLDELELQDEARRLRTKLIEQYVKRLKQTLSSKLETSDRQETQKLLKEVRQLNYLLSEVNSGQEQ